MISKVILKHYNVPFKRIPFIILRSESLAKQVGVCVEFFKRVGRRKEGGGAFTIASPLSAVQYSSHFVT